MSDLMTFPNTVEEFMEQYKIVDTEKVYTNGAELVPIFRMEQWFEHADVVELEGSKAYKCLSYTTTGNPTADVVEVVRCKDCAYKQYYFTNDMVKCGCGNGSHHEYFFCADGERREDVEETD